SRPTESNIRRARRTTSGASPMTASRTRRSSVAEGIRRQTIARPQRCPSPPAGWASEAIPARVGGPGAALLPDPLQAVIGIVRGARREGDRYRQASLVVL